MSLTNLMMVLCTVLKGTFSAVFPSADASLNFFQTIAATFFHSYEPSVGIEIAITQE